MMQITIDVPESLLRDTITRALNAAFANERYGSGAGAAHVQQQVNDWARTQDFGPLIAQLAGPIVREVVADELANAVRRIAKKQVKMLATSGELASLFQGENDD